MLLQNEYLAAENKILRAHLPARLRLSDPERSTLAEIGKRLGRRALAQVACVAKPETILAWYRRLIAQKFDGSKKRGYPGRPRIDREIEALVVQMARENSGWGYDRIAGALSNLGYRVSDETIGNVLRRHGIAPAPKRGQNTTWKEFIAIPHGSPCWHRLLHCRSAHLARAGDLLCAVLHSSRNSPGQRGGSCEASRRSLDATNGDATPLMRAPGYLDQRRYALQDRDAKFCPSFQATLASGGIKSIQLPAHSPSLNLCGTMGPLSKAGMPVETGLVRRSLTATCAA
jgi:putative transposase